MPAADGGVLIAAGEFSARLAGLPYHIDALLHDPGGALYGDSWGPTGVVGQPAALTFSFMTQAPDYASRYDIQGFQPFSAGQMAAARAALATWAEVADVTFTEVPSGGDIAFGTSSNGFSGYAFAPGDWGGAGDVFLRNTSPDNSALEPGGTAFRRLIHETGHALGLKHPGNYNVTAPPYLPDAEDNYRFTVMSYHADPGMSVEPTTPQLYDVAAVQYLYGANMRTRAGDDTYTLPAGEPFARTLWDAGGIDTIDLSNQPAGVVIDLQGGHFSSIGVREAGGAPAKDNFAIAFGAIIENATGSIGADTMLGNTDANRVSGGAGADQIAGGDGGDQLYGNTGTDTLIGDRDDDTLFGGQDGDQVFGGAGDDRLYGNLGADRLAGEQGADSLFGGQGGDLLFGGDGDDVLFGNLGDDTLAGGLGADRFAAAGDGADVVTDFSTSDGDRILVSPGWTWTVADGLTGAVVDFGGVSLILTGVRAAQVMPGWFVSA